MNVIPQNTRRLTFALFSLLTFHLASLPNAIAATPTQVTCKPGKLGYEEALPLYLKKAQGEYSEPAIVNLYEDAVLQVQAKGIENWIYVRVIGSKSPKDKDLEGWVNAKGLQCNGKVAQVKPAICEVTGLQSGELSLRATPGGKSKAGLKNGNNVTLLKTDIPLTGTLKPWIYVRVTNAVNTKLQGMEGWINPDYVMCYSQQNNDAVNYP